MSLACLALTMEDTVDDAFLTHFTFFGQKRERIKQQLWTLVYEGGLT